MAVNRTRVALIVVSAGLLGALWFLALNFAQGRVAQPADGLGAGGSALLGALIGGGFSLGGQFIAGRIQSRVQRAKEISDRALADAKWERDSEAQTRAALHDDVRDILEELTAVHRELEAAVPTFAEAMGKESWEKRWPAIWTDERSLKIGVMRELILDEDARDALKRVVKLLDQSPNITSPSYPGRVAGEELRVLGMKLASSGIGIVAPYLRNERYTTTDEEYWKPLETAASQYKEWEAEQERRASEDDYHREQARIDEAQEEEEEEE